MFTHAHDVVDAVSVFLMSGSANSDSDYEKYTSRFVEVHDQAEGRQSVTIVLVVDPGNPPPSAAWRKKIAERTRDLTSRLHFAMVTDSILIRGVLTAINWLRTPGYLWSIHPDFDSAVREVESRRGKSLPVLHELLQRARKK